MLECPWPKDDEREFPRPMMDGSPSGEVLLREAGRPGAPVCGVFGREEEGCGVDSTSDDG